MALAAVAPAAAVAVAIHPAMLTQSQTAQLTMRPPTWVSRVPCHRAASFSYARAAITQATLALVTAKQLWPELAAHMAHPTTDLIMVLVDGVQRMMKITSGRAPGRRQVCQQVC